MPAALYFAKHICCHFFGQIVTIGCFEKIREIDMDSSSCFE